MLPTSQNDKFSKVHLRQAKKKFKKNFGLVRRLLIHIRVNLNRCN